MIKGGGSTVLTIDTGSSTIANAGLIESTGAGGVTILSALANTGTMAALGGVFVVNGAVSGAGQALVNGGTLEFEQQFNEAVMFAGAGTLELAQSQTFHQLIAGFSGTGTDILDLADIVFGRGTQSTYVDNGQKTGGVLTVTDGVHTAKINLVGNYTMTTFLTANDGNGGVLVSGSASKNSDSSPATVAQSVAVIRHAATAAALAPSALAEPRPAVEPEPATNASGLVAPFRSERLARL